MFAPTVCADVELPMVPTSTNPPHRTGEPHGIKIQLRALGQSKSAA